jgi:protocatechuate 3,4-dioxygenase beta subunit
MQKAGVPTAQSRAVTTTDLPKTGTEKSINRLDFRGRVVDPEGKPVRGAKLYVVYMTPAILPPPKVQAVSDAKGNFRFTMAKSEFDTSQRNESWRSAYLVAIARGYAVDVALAGCFDVSGSFSKENLANLLVSPMFPTDATLRLVEDDLTVEGRIVNSEGRPVVGATIRVLYFRAPEKGDLTPWLQSAKSGEDYDVTRPVLGRGKTIVPAQAQQFQYVMPTATTGADGKFRLRGIGRERIARLLLEGPGIASEKLYCYTRPGPMFRMAHLLESPRAGTLVYYGASFEHVARPSMQIVGTVRDRDTGKPLGGITIETRRFGRKSVRGPSRGLDMVFAGEHVRAVTDNRGHYRLTGVPDEEGNSILAVPPLDQPYFMSIKGADHGDEKDLARVDFQLKRGVWIRGRVTDNDTGKPVRGNVTYYPMADNTHSPSLAGLDWTPNYPGYAGFYRTDEEGRYAIPGLPGRGIIAIRAARGPYRRGAGAEEIRGGKPHRFMDGDSTVVFQTALSGSIIAANYHALAEVNPAEDAEAYERSITLDPGQRLTCTVLDPAGQPLAGAWFIDIPRYHAIRGPMASPIFKIEGYYLDQPRTVYFVHKERKLTGTLLLEGPQQGPLSIRLEPWGKITGQVVDENGNPEANLLIAGHASGTPTAPYGYGRFAERHYRTDQQGHFRIEGLALGVPYELLVRKKIPSGQRYGEIIIGSTLKTGETRDLGDLMIKQWRRAPTKRSNL